MVCLACPDAFSQMMPLAVHPRAKHSLALRLRTLCRRALRLGSALHRRLCWQLLGHPGEDVRSHIWLSGQPWLGPVLEPPVIDKKIK